jgi:ABC-2 type transport system permease protein
MRRALARWLEGPFWALALKELRQIRRDRRLALSLVIPPTLQVVLFGLALDSEVRNLQLGVVDQSRTAESRALVSMLTENRTFRLAGYYVSPAELGDALSRGRLDVGVVVPYDFTRQRQRGRPVTVQVLLNAVNANTAQIAQGYVEGAIASFNGRTGPPVAGSGAPDPAVSPSPDAVGPAQPVAARIELRAAFLYNPGLVNAWFIVTGVLGTLITLNGSLVAAATMIREKESGTVEQLLMTPATAVEIVAAKIAPLFVLLMGMVGLVLTVARVVFHVPFRGSLTLLLIASAFCVLTGIGIGTLIATLARSATQTQMISFFVNPPLASLSGALTPIEAMPAWIQPLTVVNPITHFAAIARGVLMKGAGLDTLYLHLLALVTFATFLVGVSAWRFRRQLG